MKRFCAWPGTWRSARAAGNRRPPFTPACALLLAALFSAASGFADQTDPGLDALFDRIKRAEDPQEAAGIERRIWRIWIEAGDDKTNKLMGDGIDAMNAARIERAIELFTAVIRRSPSFAEGWNKRATAYYLNGDMAASVGDIERTLALEPRHFGAVSGLGLIFLSRGDKIAALEAFRRVLAIHPHAPGAKAHVRMIEDALKDQGA